jgi:hypothetical protein
MCLREEAVITPSMRAANWRNEASDQGQQVSPPRHPGLGEDVVAVRSRGGFRDPECVGRLGETCAGDKLFHEPGLGRREAVDTCDRSNIG